AWPGDHEARGRHGEAGLIGESRADGERVTERSAAAVEASRDDLVRIPRDDEIARQVARDAWVRRRRRRGIDLEAVPERRAVGAKAATEDRGILVTPDHDQSARGVPGDRRAGLFPHDDLVDWKRVVERRAMRVEIPAEDLVRGPGHDEPPVFSRRDVIA